MRKNGTIVPPQSTKDIYIIAEVIRSVFSEMMALPLYVPIDRIYEVLPELIEGFSFEVVTKADIGDDHGLTYPGKQIILIREDIYDGACRGNGRDRFTMAHELGHLFLHREVRFARSPHNTTVPIYMNSEWQADTFASGFLVDKEALGRCKSVEEVTDTFGISIAAAKCRFGKNEGRAGAATPAHPFHQGSRMA